jgi:hypothetical protein
MDRWADRCTRYFDIVYVFDVIFGLWFNRRFFAFGDLTKQGETQHLLRGDTWSGRDPVWAIGVSIHLFLFRQSVTSSVLSRLISPSIAQDWRSKKPTLYCVEIKQNLCWERNVRVSRVGNHKNREPHEFTCEWAFFLSMSLSVIPKSSLRYKCNDDASDGWKYSSS